MIAEKQKASTAIEAQGTTNHKRSYQRRSGLSSRKSLSLNLSIEIKSILGYLRTPSLRKKDRSVGRQLLESTLKKRIALTGGVQGLESEN